MADTPFKHTMNAGNYNFIFYAQSLHSSEAMVAPSDLAAILLRASLRNVQVTFLDLHPPTFSKFCQRGLFGLCVSTRNAGKVALLDFRMRGSCVLSVRKAGKGSFWSPHATFRGDRVACRARGMRVRLGFLY